jgi:alpha-tubulin suppressor-like RCC1 family protein
LTVHGKVVCWGRNDNGQCDVPADLDRVSAISCGWDFTAALSRDGVVRCWGQNSSGHCNIPADLGKVVSLSCGRLHVAALTEDGRLVCWGDNGSGQCTVSSDLQVMMPEMELATLLVPADIQPQQTDEVELLPNQLAAASAERDQFKRQLESSDESNVEVRCGIETFMRVGCLCVYLFVGLYDTYGFVIFS